jgi:hypothetical protein
MKNDNTFEALFILFVIGIVISKSLKTFDYAKAIYPLKIFLIYLTLIIVLGGAMLFFVFKMIYPLAESFKIAKHYTTKKELPKSKKQCTTKKEVSKITKNVKPKKVKSSNKKLTKTAKQEVSINVDEYKGFYRHKDLNSHEIEYLLRKKYQIVDKLSIVSGKVEKFLIKPRFNESLNHMFVTFDIEEFLEKKGIEVEKFITKKPDLTFEINKKKIAVEVETGTAYNKSRKQLLEKVKELNKSYDYWFFVVTDRNYVKKYKKLGKAVDIRCIKYNLDRVLNTDMKKLKKNWRS